MHVFIAIVFLSGLLQFSFIQVVNLAVHKPVCRGENYGFIILSVYISICFNYGPFFMSLYLIRWVYLISRMDTDDSSIDGGDEEDGMDESENSKKDFTSVNSPHRDSSIKQS